ncbi:MAG: iron ABC transporter permease [Planctomycetota bacterium]|nr:iron ABC transporter permease [Planctomycetota bacterium]
MNGRGAIAALGAALLALVAMQVGIGVDSGIAVVPADVARACLALVGLAEPLPGYAQDVITWRLWRALTAAGVGACLALAGTLLQGLFRNPLASPSLIGVTAGANLGATAALLALGGYGAALELADAVSTAPYLVTLAAFTGSLMVALVVVTIATRSGPGPTSIATILLLGVALNSCIAGALSAIENVLMDARDYGTLNALQAWSFGTLDDRKAYHAVLVGLGAMAGAASIPFVARELDLLSGGDEDAESLGVSILRTRMVALTVAALATACAVAAAGQVGFVGLVVPHLLRLLVGASHRTLLPLSLLGGAVFVLGTDLAQVLVIGERPLRAGVLMSLLGGPFFLVLLVVHARRRVGW